MENGLFKDFQLSWKSSDVSTFYQLQEDYIYIFTCIYQDENTCKNDM